MSIDNIIIEGSLEVKHPTIWTDEKAEVRRARREQSQRGEKSEEKRSEEDAGVRKGRKVAKHCVFFDVLWLRRVEN